MRDQRKEFKPPMFVWEMAVAIGTNQPLLVQFLEDYPYNRCESAVLINKHLLPGVEVNGTDYIGVDGHTVTVDVDSFDDFTSPFKIQIGKKGLTVVISESAINDMDNFAKWYDEQTVSFDRIRIVEKYIKMKLDKADEG